MRPGTWPETQRNDLAVLKVELTGFACRHLRRQFDQLVVGDPVYAIGKPAGRWSCGGTLTDGIVSAINRDVQVDGRTMTLVQTNAALQLRQFRRPAHQRLRPGGGHQHHQDEL